MNITSCKTNHLINPLGYAMDTATISWITEDTNSTKQVAAQVIVANDPDLKNILYDSGKSIILSNLAFELPVKLKPYTRYFWNVKVWGDFGDEAISEINWFETAKRDDLWQGKWITPAWQDKSLHPYIRKNFYISKEIKCARIYVTGMGLYELEINGIRVGNEYLTPYCNSYDSWVQYQTFDITDMLQVGENIIGALLGNGWAKGRFGTFGNLNTPYVNDFAFLCELRISLTDGHTQIICTNDDWQCFPSPIIADGIYDGEIYDANKEIPNWSKPESDDCTWDNVQEFAPQGLGELVERLSLPVLIKETIKPIKLIHTPAGETVIDMGQNMVGWISCQIIEPKGVKIKLTYGEILQEGNFYRKNLRSAKAEYIYISDGEARTVQPHFTYFGFRYVKLEGFTKQIDLSNFTGCVVYSDLELIGHIETSDPYVNRLFANALWSQKGNFLDVPTDCPQRDERMGWTGDAQVFSGTASFNMDTYAFYTKFMHDIYQEQKLCDGMVASVVPTFCKIKSSDSSFAGGGSCAWSDCATIVPWEVYLHYGDKNILKHQYQSMKDWVDWIINQDKRSGNRKLWTVGFQFGDWLALDGPITGGVIGGTDNGFLASAYYLLSTNILAKSASILGFNSDAKFYSKLSEKIKTAIQNEYFSKNGRSTISTQTAHVIALHFDLLPNELRNRVLNDLKALLNKSGMHLTTGFVGTPYLCRTLSDNGDPDSAYKIFFQEDFPSWLYEVMMGATTIWERWDSIKPDGRISDNGMNSLNHYAYGSIVEWMYRNMCGINPCEDHPGFKKIIFKPDVFGKLDYAKATLKSSMGIIESGWKIEKDGTLTINVTIPFNATAILYLPDADLSTIKTAASFKASQDGTKVKLELSTGHYYFNYLPTNDYTIKYSISTPLRELLSIPATKDILLEFIPNIEKFSQGLLGVELPYSITELKETNLFVYQMMFSQVDLESLNTKLMAVQAKDRSTLT